ncbi:MAG: cytochrome c biogenesis protein ResB [Propionibacteriaceae bacterium]|nr:cytochrome c biogenesis protein ResB [Propionibacteriaceae bacterium]
MTDRPDPDVSVTEDSDEAVQVSVADFFHRLYQVTYSKTIGLIIVLTLAVFVFLGVIITQAGPGVWDNPMAQEQFMDQMYAKFGGWASIMSFLGLFHIFSSIGFYIVIGALTISLLGCTTHRLPQLWQRWRHPKVVVSSHFFSAARYNGSVESNLDDVQTLRTAADHLKSKRYRIISGNETSLYADKNAWGGFGTPIAHLSFILIMAAFVITSLTALQQVLVLSIGGDAREVEFATNLTVEAVSFEATIDPETDRPLDYVAHLILRDSGEIVAERDVRVNEPLRYHGFSFHQYNYGDTVEVKVTDRNDEVVYAGPVELQWLSDNGWYRVGEFVLPERGIEVAVYILAAGVVTEDLEAGQVAFMIFQEGADDPMASVVVDQGDFGTVGDLNFGFVRENRYTGIMVRNDPGEIWMLFASILLVGGMTMTFAFRHRRLWVRAQDGKLLFASSDKEEYGFRQEFDQLLSQATAWFPVRRK